MFRFTLSEQRPWLPYEAGEGRAKGLGSGVRKEGAGAHEHVRSGFIPGVCSIKTKSTGTASGTCFGKEEKQKQNRAVSHTRALTSAEPGLTTGKGGPGSSPSSNPLPFSDRSPSSCIPRRPRCPQGGHGQQRWQWVNHHDRGWEKCGPGGCTAGHMGTAERMPLRALQGGCCSPQILAPGTAWREQSDSS